MPKIDHILSDVERLIETVKPQEAEDKLRSLLATIGDAELRTWEADLRLTIGRFLPKRRRALLATLEQRLRGGPDGEEGDWLPLRRGEVQDDPSPNVPALGEAFSDELQALSERHIYQWSTFYRDTMAAHFDGFFEVASKANDPAEVLDKSARH